MQAVNSRTWDRKQIEVGLAYLKLGLLPPGEKNPSRFRERWAGYTVDSGGVIITPDKKIVVPAEQKEDTLRKMWEADDYRVLGRDRFYNKIALTYAGISKSDVMEFLERCETYQLHKLLPKEKAVKPVIANVPNQRWQVDLVDMSSYSSPANKNMSWLLTAVDIFTKRLRVVPLPNKEGATVAGALERLLHQATPKAIQSDRGSEFISDEFQAVLKKFGVRQFLSKAYTP